MTHNLQGKKLFYKYCRIVCFLRQVSVFLTSSFFLNKYLIFEFMLNSDELLTIRTRFKLTFRSKLKVSETHPSLRHYKVPFFSDSKI